MTRFGFISRHMPTPEQDALAAAKGIELVWLGDCDAFGPLHEETTPEPVRRAVTKSGFEGFVVAHPALAIRLLGLTYRVGVFENAARAEEGRAPAFVVKALHVFDCVHNGTSLTFAHDGANIGTFIFYQK